MRAIRDNEIAASAMGKDITWRHLQVFVLGSAVVGIAGAMLTTLDGQFTPASYQPLRFTFLIWVMDTDSALRHHLMENAAHMRLMTMGLVLLLALRFAPQGLIPEGKR